MSNEAVDRRPKTPSTSVSGLDMGPTIAWYAANQERFSSLLPWTTEALPFQVQNPQLMHIDERRIAALVTLFPREAIARSRLHRGSIIGGPTLYFSKETTGENIQTTSDPSQALSPTAIIPSRTDNTRWRETGVLSGDIYLYQIPQVPREVAMIIHAQALLHEFAHTIVTQALYGEGQTLMLPDGKIVNSREYIMKFAKAAEKRGPISRYSSYYRKPGEGLTSPLAIEEELVETIAAHLLGFVYSDDSDPYKRFDPRAYDGHTHDGITSLVSDFLRATLLDKKV